VGSRLYLACEILALFVGLPVSMYARIVPRFPILVLLIAAGVCVGFLCSDPGFPRAFLWNVQGARDHARGALLGFAVLGALLVAVVAWRMPGHLFDLVRTRPRLWILVMVLYPVLSVYPQEIVYRAFFFQRYAELLPTAAIRIGASALAFAIGHVMFPRPWIAMSLTFVGGLLFAYHYEGSHSLLLVSVEHGLFGQLIFTIGLGRFFYSGEGTGARMRSTASGPPPVGRGDVSADTD
jgi:membrane protease YdiL (CAAX protease family)